MADSPHSIRDPNVRDWVQIPEAEYDRLKRLEEQYALFQQSLDEVHEVQCGCDQPGRSDLCVAQPPTSFAVLGEAVDA